MGKKRQRKPAVKDDQASVQPSETAADGAKKGAQGSGDIELAGEATATRRVSAAEARSDRAEASASVREAESVAEAAGAEADRGAEDLTRGAELTELSDDFVSMAAAVRSLGIDEVRRGMELAAMSGTGGGGWRRARRPRYAVGGDVPGRDGQTDALDGGS